MGTISTENRRQPTDIQVLLFPTHPSRQFLTIIGGGKRGGGLGGNHVPATVSRVFRKFYPGSYFKFWRVQVHASPEPAHL